MASAPINVENKNSKTFRVTHLKKSDTIISGLDAKSVPRAEGKVSRRLENECCRYQGVACLRGGHHTLPKLAAPPESSANFCSRGLDTGAMLAKRASNTVTNAAHVPNAALLNHMSAGELYRKRFFTSANFSASPATPLIANPSSTSFKKSITVAADVPAPVNVGPILISYVLRWVGMGTFFVDTITAAGASCVVYTGDESNGINADESVPDGDTSPRGGGFV